MHAQQQLCYGGVMLWWSYAMVLSGCSSHVQAPPTLPDCTCSNTVDNSIVLLPDLGVGPKKYDAFSK